jgi:transcriptional regulator with GAF, ATPase, and Fis domain
VVAAKATDDQILETLRKHNGIRAVAAAELGLNERTFLHRLKRMKAQGASIPVSTYQPGRRRFNR